MDNVIKPAQRVKRVKYDLVFDDLENPGCGFSFPCNHQGKATILHWLRLKPIARKNLAMVLKNPERYPSHLDKREWTEYIPAVIRCVVCGKEVTLNNAWASSCPGCGTEYNGGGQHLAPRSQWEEMGETS